MGRMGVAASGAQGASGLQSWKPCAALAAPVSASPSAHPEQLKANGRERTPAPTATFIMVATEDAADAFTVSTSVVCGTETAASALP